MGALENVLSEEIDLPSRHDGDLRHHSANSPPSTVEPSASLTNTFQATPATTSPDDKNKVIAAAVGATLTSLTMTPFDVVKTRLQTQAPQQHFIPSSHLPRPNSHSSTTPWPPPVASTSKAVLPDRAGSVSSTSVPSSSSSACCTKTYFSSNKDKSLLCRFDPRLSLSSLPASGSHATATSSRHAPVAFVHLMAPTVTFAHGPTPVLSGACLFPTLEEAAISGMTSSSATSTSASATLGSGSLSQPRHFTGFFDAVTKIVRHEGLSAMWRGTAPALAMSVPGQVIYMVGYDWGRRTAYANAPSWARVSSVTPSVTGSFSSTDALTPSYTTAVPLVAGALSRTVVAALTSPLELVRTRLQAQSATSSTSIGAIIASIRSDSGGWTSAWRGLPVTLWRDVPFSGIYWAGYEAIKRGLTGGKGMGEGWEGQGAGREFTVAFTAGAGSGMIAATLTNPFDVVKTRRQALETDAGAVASGDQRRLTRTFPILLDIARREGWQGLMRGLTPRLAKVGPACGIMIASYEGLSLVLDRRATQ